MNIKTLEEEYFVLRWEVEASYKSRVDPIEAGFLKQMLVIENDSSISRFNNTINSVFVPVVEAYCTIRFPIDEYYTAKLAKIDKDYKASVLALDSKKEKA